VCPTKGASDAQPILGKHAATGASLRKDAVSGVSVARPDRLRYNAGDSPMSTASEVKPMPDAEAFKDNERRAWNQCAQTYDRWLTDPFTAFAKKVVTLAGLRPGQRVLDVATGTGLAALMAATLVGPEGRVLGVDLSDSMTELAWKRASEQRLSNVDFLRMDAEELELPSESFDAVLCALGLMLFPQPDRALSEMHRVLKHEGVMVLSVFGRGSRVALRALMDPFIPHMPPPGARGPSIFSFGRSEVLEEALERAGFSDAMVDQQAHTLVFETPDSVWEMLLSLGRLAQLHSELPASAQEKLRQQVLHVARESYLQPRGVLELPFEMTYAVARR
jgi:ubiquinone/menaquinone biosynthesis C-methylase UbiE